MLNPLRIRLVFLQGRLKALEVSAGGIEEVDLNLSIRYHNPLSDCLDDRPAFFEGQARPAGVKVLGRRHDFRLGKL